MENKFKVGDIVKLKNSDYWKDILFQIVECNDYGYIHIYAIEKQRVDDGLNMSAEADDLEFVELTIRDTKDNDAVNHPSHYTSHPSGIECIEVTKHFDFCIGCAIKYLWRNGLKQDAGKSTKDKQIEDLKKAIWYINAEIDLLNKN